MRKQIRGAMLALAVLAGVGGVQQRVNTQLTMQAGKDMTQTPANAPAASVVLTNFAVLSRRVIPGGFMQEPIWMARSKRSNRSRHDYGR